MSTQEFESSKRDRMAPVRGRDLAVAWFAAAVVVASVLLLTAPRGVEHLPPDLAPAASGMHDDTLVPDGTGEMHAGIETCSTQDWVNERC